MASGYEKHECGVDPSHGWGQSTPQERRAWWHLDRVILAASWALMAFKIYLAANFLGV